MKEDFCGIFDNLFSQEKQSIKREGQTVALMIQKIIQGLAVFTQHNSTDIENKTGKIKRCIVLMI